MPYIPIVLEWQFVAGDSAISAGVTSYISSFNSTMIVPNFDRIELSGKETPIIFLGISLV